MYIEYYVTITCMDTVNKDQNVKKLILKYFLIMISYLQSIIMRVSQIRPKWELSNVIDAEFMVIKAMNVP